jgi:hypothetical protein
MKKLWNAEKKKKAIKWKHEDRIRHEETEADWLAKT